MVKVIRLGNGHITLRTTKAEEHVEALIRSHTFWERVSDLIEKDAHRSEEGETTRALNQILAKLNGLQLSNISGEIGATAADLPTDNGVSLIPPSPPTEVKIEEATLNFSKLSPKGLIGNMRKKKGG